MSEVGTYANTERSVEELLILKRGKITFSVLRCGILATSDFGW